MHQNLLAPKIWLCGLAGMGAHLVYGRPGFDSHRSPNFLSDFFSAMASIAAHVRGSFLYMNYFY